MGGLVERDTELATLHALVAAAARGSGGSLVVAGPAGIGKTALVRHARSAARASGLTVLSSALTPVSPDLPHSVVRDWFGSVARATAAGAPPFDGPAEALADALRAGTTAHRAWDLAGLDYAVSWVVESLTERHPVLLVVDDVQWADTGSLQLLDLLSARLPGLPAALVLARRTGEHTQGGAALDRIAARSVRVEPAPLSVAGVEEVRRTHGGMPRAREDSTTAASGVPAAELHRLTGGNPFLVQEVLRSGSVDGSPPRVVESVRERLERLGPDAVAVARTVAVLGDEADIDTVADLTDRTVADLTGTLAVLRDADLVTLRTWNVRTTHPLVAEAVLSSMTPAQRSTLHRAVAELFRDRGEPEQVVAAHLLHTLPGEDPAVVDLLRRVGAESLRSGATEVAARQLRRAADETRPEDTDPELVALAASAHLQAGLRSEAFDLWAVAFERSRDPEQLARMLADMGQVRMTMGEREAASDAFRRAVRVLDEAGHDASSPQMRGVLVRMGLARALYEGARAEILSAVTLAEPQEPALDSHDDRLLFALAASDLAVRAEDRPRALELARRALGAGALLEEETSDGFGLYVASAVLSWADAYDENAQLLEDALADARRRGSRLGFATASYCRGIVHHRQGDHRRALADVQAALDLRARGWSDFAAPAVSCAALAHIALGQRAEAAALEATLREAATRGEFVTAQPMAVAGVVRAAHGDHEQALADYREAARLMGAHPDNASIVEWRELSVWSLLALDHRHEAADLAEEAVVLARRWGAPRALGFALRTLARTKERDEACALLREAVELLDTCGSADHRARATVDLASRLLDGGPTDREEAVSLLRDALEQGRSSGVGPLAGRAGRLLAQAGIPVSAHGAVSATLTAGERRVAELACGGATNREIAQKLFVTVKAVEWHLSNVYRKLGISSRRELPARIYAEPSSSSDM